MRKCFKNVLYVEHKEKLRITVLQVQHNNLFPCSASQPRHPPAFKIAIKVYFKIQLELRRVIDVWFDIWSPNFEWRVGSHLPKSLNNSVFICNSFHAMPERSQIPPLTSLLAPTGALIVIVSQHIYTANPLFEILSISANIFSFSFCKFNAD